MNNRIINTILFVSILMVAGCDSGMLANHPINEDGAKLEIALITSAVAYFSQDMVTLSGRVVLCSLNNTGNPNVRVSINGAFENRVIYTDANGNFTFNDIRPGEFTLSAYRQGYDFIPSKQTIILTGSGMNNLSFETMVTWEKKISGNGWDKSNSIIQTNDCSFISAGYSDSHNNVGNKDFFIVKIGMNGNEEWRKTYGGLNSEIAYSISRTDDPSYVIASGYSFSNTAGLSDFYVTRINTADSFIGEWQKLYGGTGQDVSYSIKSTKDAGFIVAGYSDSFGSGENDIMAKKLSSDGSCEWTQVYGGEHSDSANSIAEVSAGGYVVAGNREDDAGNYDIWIIRLDESGSITWDKPFNKGQFDDATDIKETSDGGFVIAGYTDQDSGHYWIIKLDQSGNVEWEKLDDRNNSSALNSISQTFDGGYIAAGRRYSYTTTDNDMYIIKLNSIGELEWEKTFDGDYKHEDEARSIIQTSDGGYVVAGYTTTYENKTDVWIIKLNREGNLIH